MAPYRFRNLQTTFKKASKILNMHRFGPFTLDPARRVLTREGRTVAITARPFDILLALVDRAGEIVDKDEMLKLVWPDTVVEEANLSQQIFLLRKLLGHTDEQPYIATVPRRGYQFVAAVVSEPRAPVSPPSVTAAVPALAGPARLDMALPAGTSLALRSTRALALAPDGSHVVCVVEEGGTTRLYARSIGRFDGRLLPGTEGASGPFFSPDGQWVGFESGRVLRKMRLDGGPALPLCDVADMRGAAWRDCGDIVFAPGPTTGLWRVDASGGTAAPLTTLAFDAGERTHRWPHAVSGSSDVLFTIGHHGAQSFDEASLAITSVASPGHHLVLRHATDGRWQPGGHLIWSRGGALFAASFDIATARLNGPPRMVQDAVATSATGVAHFDWSRNGVLIHAVGTAQTMRRALVTVGRDGAEKQRHLSGEALEEPRLAPDGTAAIISLRNRRSDLWSYDFTRGSLTRLTFDGENFAGIWGPVPGLITYSSSQGGPSDLYLLRPGHSSAPRLFVSSAFDKIAGGWSPDGSVLLFTEYHPDTGADLWLVDRDGAHARPFLRTKFNEYSAVIAPDGRHAAYVTDESGRPEIMAVTFPDAAVKYQLSTDGGTEPVWSPAGSDLFYRSGNRMMRVDLRDGLARAGIPTTLFEGAFVGTTITLANFDVSDDASMFLMVRDEQPAPPSMLAVTIGIAAGSAPAIGGDR